MVSPGCLDEEDVGVKNLDLILLSPISCWCLPLSNSRGSQKTGKPIGIGHSEQTYIVGP